VWLTRSWKPKTTSIYQNKTGSASSVAFCCLLHRRFLGSGISEASRSQSRDQASPFQFSEASRSVPFFRSVASRLLRQAVPEETHKRFACCFRSSAIYLCAVYLCAFYLCAFYLRSVYLCASCVRPRCSLVRPRRANSGSNMTFVFVRQCRANSGSNMTFYLCAVYLCASCVRPRCSLAGPCRANSGSFLRSSAVLACAAVSGELGKQHDIRSSIAHSAQTFRPHPAQTSLAAGFDGNARPLGRPGFQ